MSDREKVIKGLECCINRNDCRNCPYADGFYKLDCIDKTKSDAVYMINEQQREIEELEERLAIVLEGQPEIVRCKYCWKREFDNCPFNEHLEYKPEDDFFCADGERKEGQ